MAYVLQAAFIYVVPSVVLVVFNRLVHNFLRKNERNLTAHTAAGVRRPSQPVVAAEPAVLPVRRYTGDAEMLLLQPNDEKTPLDDLKEVCCERSHCTHIG